MSPAAHLDDSNLLAAYIEGRVSDEERRRVTEHLTRCDACRATLAALARETEDADNAPLRVGGRQNRWTRIRPIVWLPLAATLIIGTIAGLRVFQPPAELGAPPSTAGTARPIPPPPSDVNTQPTGSPPPAGPGTAPATDVDPSLLVRRGGERRINDKTFRLVAGEWIDTTYDSLSGLRQVEAATAQETRALVERMPTLKPYAALGSRVLVVLDGTVYRLRSDE